MVNVKDRAIMARLRVRDGQGCTHKSCGGQGGGTAARALQADGEAQGTGHTGQAGVERGRDINKGGTSEIDWTGSQGKARYRRQCLASPGQVKIRLHFSVEEKEDNKSSPPNPRRGDASQQAGSELLAKKRALEKKMGRMERRKGKVQTFKQEGIRHQFLFNEEIREWMIWLLRGSLEEYYPD